MNTGFAIRALAVALTISAAISAPTAASAATQVNLKFAFPAPFNSYVNIQGMGPWIKRVEKASDGTLKIKLFAGTTLANGRDVYDRTLNNVAQLSFGIFGPFASQFPRTQVADLPFLSDNAAISSVALWRLYATGLLAPEYKNVKVLALFNFPSAALNTNKPVKTLEDVKGMKLVVSSRPSAEMAAALGASPVTLTPPETYQGLSRGLAEGSIISWTAVKTFRLAEVTKDHLEAPLGEAPAFVFMNKSAYASLPPKAKAAIDKYSGQSFSKILGTNNQAASDGESKKVAAEPGHSVTKLSAAQYAIWQARIEPVIDAWVKHAPDGAKVLAGYRAEIKKAAAIN